MKIDTPGLLARFIYTPAPSSNRRATGSHWRGDKLHALITIRLGATVYKAANHEAVTWWGMNKQLPASRICRASGEVMDNKWFFRDMYMAFYVIDTDVTHVELASVDIRKVKI